SGATRAANPSSSRAPTWRSTSSRWASRARTFRSPTTTTSRWRSWCSRVGRRDEARAGDGGRGWPRAQRRRRRAAAASPGGRCDPLRAQLRRAAAAHPARPFDPRAAHSPAPHRRGPRGRASAALPPRLHADSRDGGAREAVGPRPGAGDRRGARLRLRDRERAAGARRGLQLRAGARRRLRRVERDRRPRVPSRPRRDRGARRGAAGGIERRRHDFRRQALSRPRLRARRFAPRGADGRPQLRRDRGDGPHPVPAPRAFRHGRHDAGARGVPGGRFEARGILERVAAEDPAREAGVRRPHLLRRPVDGRREHRRRHRRPGERGVERGLRHGAPVQRSARAGFAARRPRAPPRRAHARAPARSHARGRDFHRGPQGERRVPRRHRESRARKIGVMSGSAGAEAAPFDSAAFLAGLPNLPGVYRFKNAAGEVIYVGKASDLRKRVSSYFQRNLPSPRTAMMVSQIAGGEVTPTRTEAEALLVENNLIKSLAPRYNVLFKDDKSYGYILLTGHEFPQIRFYRGAHAKGNRYFGPFPSAWSARDTINHLQKIFLLRTFDDTVFAHRSRPCLLHQIHRCSAPCVRLVTGERYARDVRHAEQFLEGKETDVIEDLTAKMNAAAEGQRYEEAAHFRDQIRMLQRILSGQAAESAGAGDVDIVAVAEREGTWCVTLAMVRGGRHLGDRSFFPHNASGSDALTVIEAFL